MTEDQNSLHSEILHKCEQIAENRLFQAPIYAKEERLL